MFDHHAGQCPHEGRLGLLTQRHDQGVSGQRLEPPGRPWVTRLVEFHDLDLQFGAVEGGDRPQPVDPHALTFGLLGLLLVSRHLLPRAAVDDDGVVGTEPTRDARSVHRGVAAAVDRDMPSDRGLFAGGDAAQKRHRVDHGAGVSGRDVDTFGQVRTDRDEHRVEAALVPLGGEVLDPVSAGELDAQCGDAVELDLEHVAGQPVVRDAVTHHSAGLGARVADLDLVAEACQMVGRRKPTRSGADDQHPPAAADGRRIEHPALLPRKVAEEPLHRMDRYCAVEMCSVANGFTRVIAHPSVDCG